MLLTLIFSLIWAGSIVLAYALCRAASIPPPERRLAVGLDATSAPQSVPPPVVPPAPLSRPLACLAGQPAGICMDCRVIYRPGTFPASHGLCRDCLSKRMNSLQRDIESHESIRSLSAINT